MYLEAGTPYSARTPVAIATEYCRDCGLIRQTPNLEVKLDYTGRERATARQLPDYTDRIIGSLSELDVAPDDLILEVGSNDGTFLKALRCAGFRNLLGVEPSGWLAGRASASDLTVVNDFFNRDLAVKIVEGYGAARAVICRHTLEHVPDIRGLVQGISDVLDTGGLCFVEVPDTDWIISDLFAHEIWDEHISYFRASSLARLLQTSGLVPPRSARIRFRDTRNLLSWSRRGAASDLVAGDLVDDATGWPELAKSRWDAFAVRLRAAVAAAPRPIIAIGASHIQLNFLNFTGLDNSVDLLIDDDFAKAGRCAPLASLVPILSTPQALQSVRSGTVCEPPFPIRRYPAWEDRICDTLSPYRVGSITPYDLRSE